MNKKFWLADALNCTRKVKDSMFTYEEVEGLRAMLAAVSLSAVEGAAEKDDLDKVIDEIRTKEYTAYSEGVSIYEGDLRDTYDKILVTPSRDTRQNLQAEFEDYLDLISDLLLAL